MVATLKTLHSYSPLRREGHRRLMNFLSTGLGALLAFWQSSAEMVATVAVAASLLIIMDTLIGVVAACFFSEFRSRKLRERLVAKFLYYTLFVCCSYVVGGLIHATWMLTAPWYAICVIEIASIMETLTRLHIRGGRRFGPAERVLRVVARAMGEAASGRDESAQAILSDAADKERDTP